MNPKDIIKLHTDANNQIDKESKQIVREINSTNREVLTVIIMMLPSFTRALNVTNNRKYDTLRNQIKRIRSNAFETSEKMFLKLMKSITIDESNELSKIVGKKLAPELKRAIDHGSFSGLKYKEWWKKLEDGDLDRIVQIVRYGISTQRSEKDIIADIRKKFKTTENSSKMLVRTVGNGIINESRMNMYKDAGIKYVEYSAILDSSTSSICTSLDNQIFKISEAPVPPLHPHCRSTLIPIEKN